MTAPELVVLDVNGTLSDLAPLSAAFEAAGGDPAAVEQWFAAVLRDGFALSWLGTPRPFADVADGVLGALVDDPAVVLEALLQVEVHPDVPAGLRALAEAGLRTVTLTNGSLEQSGRLLGPLADLVAEQLSVTSAPGWKPHPGAYALALGDVDPAHAVMVAAHPWDLAGARAVGMQTVFLDRTGVPWPPAFPAPDRTVRALAEVATDW